MNAATINFGLGPILQATLPDAPWMEAHTRKLPGIGPLDAGDWLRVDDAYAGQMALKAILAARKPTEVMAALPSAEAALEELLETVLAYLKSVDGFNVTEDKVRRPDGVDVAIGDPLPTLFDLVAEDLCVLQKKEDEHCLVAAGLGFPAGWTLAQKIGRPMSAIHVPVESYNENIARRVQRMFDGIKHGRALTRSNGYFSTSSELFTPRVEFEKMSIPDEFERPYIRTERQCLLRLPKSNAVVFSIHTRIVKRAALSAPMAGVLSEFPIENENS